MSNLPHLDFPSIDQMGPMSREQIDCLLADMSRRLQSLGRAAQDAAIANGASVREDVSVAHRDMKERMSLELNAQLRATMIIALANAGKLSECDRDALVAEALFIIEEG